MVNTSAGLAYDDVGDPDGRPVVYLHGTPDSRLARHPDDSLVTAAGVRLLAVDRPGYGGTPASVAPGGLAEDLAALLDALGIERAGLLAWSGGALAAVRAAGHDALADRLTGVTLAAGLVPREAYDEPDVRAAAPHRLGLVELAETLSPEQLADAVAPMLAPYPCDLRLARAHQLEQRDAVDQATLEHVPGAVERLAEALVEAVQHGLAGVEADVADQVRPLGQAALGRVTVPVRLVYGSDDSVVPVAFGQWYAQRLPDAHLEIVKGAGHYLPFTHWPDLLSD